VTFSKEARESFLKFAVGHDARWNGNFRDLNGAIVRMATLSAGGRITNEVVNDEIARLRSAWRAQPDTEGEALLERLLGKERLSAVDLFDRHQLESVIRVCRESRTLSEAGRALFTSSREKKTTVNDADRLRKYLARFGLDWREIN
jgi:transcriptional regulatory protein RtcR